jgi:hypothetical protein
MTRTGRSQFEIRLKSGAPFYVEETVYEGLKPGCVRA